MILCPVLQSLFQSLIGILMNCNILPCGLPLVFFVSIPNRDFNELQFIVSICLGTVSVSIPNRDFNELQSVAQGEAAAALAFQSLIGILMNCNIALASQV